MQRNIDSGSLKMSNCFSCGRLKYAVCGDAVCVSGDGGEHLVLRRGEYDSEREFKDALYAECGLTCGQWLSKVKPKPQKRSKVVVAEKANVANPVSGGVSVRSGLGWIVASVLGGCLIGTYVLFFLGVI